ncbi:hypothetical protein J6590_051834 [Homalodisca vitripennis]|nr:hypothetical protein J6590_051834 [Homalodisca vitripennis]
MVGWGVGGPHATTPANLIYHPFPLGLTTPIDFSKPKLEEDKSNAHFNGKTLQ